VIQLRQPVIVTTDKGFGDDPNESLLSRHARYGIALSEVSEGRLSYLTIAVSTGKHLHGQIIHERDGLQVVSLGRARNPIGLGVAAAKWSRTNQVDTVWIAGTPFREAIACLLAQRLAGGPLQIQAHGNFGELSPSHGSLRDRLKWALARFTLPRAQSVRAVSPLQAQRLSSRFRLSEILMFVAPVPIDEIFFMDAEQKSRSRHKSIGYIGRLHNERGLAKWVEMARDVAYLVEECKFVIIGDGPHREQFLKGLTEAVGPQRIAYSGFLEGSELAKTVSRLDVFVNTWTNESYGRAMLEAAACGVPVVAVESPGALYLRDAVGLHHAAIRITNEPASEVLRICISQTSSPLSNCEEVIRFEKKAVSYLVSEWFRLALETSQ
jgi:glycosyltransferase involved in cell wall biosynthesis